MKRLSGALYSEQPELRELGLHEQARTAGAIAAGVAGGSLSAEGAAEHTDRLLEGLVDAWEGLDGAGRARLSAAGKRLQAVTEHLRRALGPPVAHLVAQPPDPARR